MILVRAPKIALLGVLAVTVAGCAREQPVYNVDNHQVPVVAQNLPMRQIENTIILAGTDRGWTFTPAGPGHLVGHLDRDHHTADVDLMYSPVAYSIHYVSSSNLLASADGTQIHRNYNKWIHLLEDDIDQELTKAAVK